MTSREQAVEDVLRNFDFAKVETAMFAVGWKWNEDTASPDRQSLVSTARHLLEMAWDAMGCCRTGGFGAAYEEPTDSEPASLTLWFTLASYEADVYS
jgi:hypothetical protein